MSISCKSSNKRDAWIFTPIGAECTLARLVLESSHDSVKCDVGIVSVPPPVESGYPSLSGCCC